MAQMPKLVAVVGPTASGKTALGVRLCQQFGGEIISADAKQVYEGVDIGTAKEKELPVPQHLIDIRPAGGHITVAEYQQLAYSTIDHLLEEKVLPVVVGGSGLYVEAIVKGYLFTGRGGRQMSPRYSSLVLGIKWDREQLRARVAERTNLWLRQGLMEEIEGLLKKGVSPEWLMTCGQPYHYFTQVVTGALSVTEGVEKTNTAINQYIKRQYTWWRRFGEVVWVADEEEAFHKTEQFLK